MDLSHQGGNDGLGEIKVRFDVEELSCFFDGFAPMPLPWEETDELTAQREPVGAIDSSPAELDRVRGCGRSTAPAASRQRS